MKRLLLLLLFAGLGLVAGRPSRHDAVRPRLTRPDNFILHQDVIYGRKFGTALTMDVVRPARNANGAAVIFIVSGGWRSDYKTTRNVGFAQLHFGELVRRGYAVFAVVHGSQPRFTIPEAVADIQRAARYIRYHAADFQIDPERIGVTGMSSGGHLSLMLGTNGNDGDAKNPDPVERMSSRVQAVACFFPPTDFLNYGGTGLLVMDLQELARHKASFDFVEFDKNERRFHPVQDEKRRRAIAREISPIYHVSKKSAPTLIIHGNADWIVPLQQGRTMIARLQESGVPAKLIVKPGEGHGWPHIDPDVATLADWFDQYLAPQAIKAVP